MTSLLTGKIIAIYYKANNDAVSEILFAAVPIDAMKKYSPKMRKVFTKYPTNKFYTITGGAKYAYSLAIKHILACCKARVIYQINKRDFVDCGNAYNAFKDLEINHFANYIHGGMEKMAAKPIIPSMIEEIYHEFDDEHGAWVRAMVVKGVAEAKYYGRIDKVAVAKYHAENICNELHEDVRKVLAELQAGSKVNNHGKAEGIHCHSVNDTNIQHELYLDRLVRGSSLKKPYNLSCGFPETISTILGGELAGSHMNTAAAEQKLEEGATAQS